MKSFISSRGCNFLSFRQWVKTCHVMVVYLVFGIFGVSTVVAQPSIVKRPATIPGYEMTELSNGILQIRKSGFEKSIFVFRPNSSNWIESVKLSKDGGTELNGGAHAPSFLITPSGKSMISQSDKKDTDETYQCDGYCAFYLTLPIWIMGYLTAMGFGCTTSNMPFCSKNSLLFLI